MKKVLSVVLSLLMILSVFSISVSAAQCDHNSLIGGIIEVQPTCNSTGIRKAFCGVCQEYVYLPVATVEHTWVWTVTKAPTINTTGLKNGVCSVCKKTNNGVVMPKLDCGVHSVFGWEKNVTWTVITDSTCTSIGKKQAWCSGCQKYIVRDIPMKDHMTKTYAHQDANCTEYGLTESVYCNTCRSYIVPAQIIPATGHNMFMPVADKEPTCTEEGKGTKICLNGDCDYTEEIVIEKLPHVDDDGDYFCDFCEVRICKCICHQDNIISRFVRIINTLLNKLLNDGEMKFSCCECMEPLEL